MLLGFLLVLTQVEVSSLDVQHLTQVWSYQFNASDVSTEAPLVEESFWEGSSTPLALRLGKRSLLVTCTASKLLVLEMGAPDNPVWEVDLARGAVGEGGWAGVPVCRGLAVYQQPNYSPELFCSSRVLVSTVDNRLLAFDSYSGDACFAFGSGGEVWLNEHTFRLGWVSGLLSAPLVLGDLVLLHAIAIRQPAEQPPFGTVLALNARSGKLVWAWNNSVPAGPALPANWNHWTSEPLRSLRAALAARPVEADGRATRCGLSWEDANANCGVECGAKGDCAQGEDCFADLTGCKDGAPNKETARCGKHWNDANTNCGNECLIKADCPEGEDCFKDISGCRMPSLLYVATLLLPAGPDNLPSQGLVALKADRGNKEWQLLAKLDPTQTAFRVPSPPKFTRVMHDYKVVVWVAQQGTTWILNAIDGKVLRREEALSAPRLSNVYLPYNDESGDNNSTLTALAASCSQLVADATSNDSTVILKPSVSLVAVDGKHAYVFFSRLATRRAWLPKAAVNSSAYANASADGPPSWCRVYQPLPGHVQAQCLVDLVAEAKSTEQLVPCSSPPYAQLQKWDLAKQSMVWEVPYGGSQVLHELYETTNQKQDYGSVQFWGSPTAGGGVVLAAGSDDQQLRAIDSQNGQPLWTSGPLPGTVRGAPVLMGEKTVQGLVCVWTHQAEADAMTCFGVVEPPKKQRWKFSWGWGSPTGDGVIVWSTVIAIAGMILLYLTGLLEHMMWRLCKGPTCRGKPKQLEEEEVPDKFKCKAVSYECAVDVPKWRRRLSPLALQHLERFAQGRTMVSSSDLFILRATTLEQFYEYDGSRPHPFAVNQLRRAVRVAQRESRLHAEITQQSVDFKDELSHRQENDMLDYLNCFRCRSRRRKKSVGSQPKVLPKVEEWGVHIYSIFSNPKDVLVFRLFRPSLTSDYISVATMAKLDPEDFAKMPLGNHSVFAEGLPVSKEIAKVIWKELRQPWSEAFPVALASTSALSLDVSRLPPDSSVLDFPPKSDPMEVERLERLLLAVRQDPNNKVLEGEVGLRKVIVLGENAEELDAKNDDPNLKTPSILWIKDCRDCKFVAEGNVAFIYVENCDDLMLTLEPGGELEKQIEAWQCRSLTINLNAGCPIIKLDQLTDALLTFGHSTYLGALVWNQVERVTLEVLDLNSGDYTTGTSVNHDASTLDQYIVRLVDGRMVESRAVKQQGNQHTVRFSTHPRPNYALKKKENSANYFTPRRKGLQVLNIRKSGPSRLFIFEFDASVADALLDRHLEDWNGKVHTLETRKGPRTFVLHRLHEGGGLAIARSRAACDIRIGDQLPLANTEVIGVVIPFYNEGYEALERTLTSLAACQRFCNNPRKARRKEPRIQLKILIVADGWLKHSESMLRYLQSLFPVNFDFLEGVYHKRPTDPELDPLHTSTMLLETTRLTPIPDSFCECEYSRVLDTQINTDSGYALDLTLMAKSENRKKPNAHDWFFQAFMMENTFSHLAFCTDAGTYFAKSALLKLVRFMRRNPNCIGSTGRQRVMTFDVQTKAEVDRVNVFNQYFHLQKSEGITLHEDYVSAFYRAVQKCDYEVSLACFMGGFSTAGMLPVIPGPCGLFRFRQSETGDHTLVQQALDLYFEKVYATAEQLGVTEGNLVLAEDRLLSAAVVFRPDDVNRTRDIWTAWEPTAVFYFEAETEPGMLLPQRRRWTNGSLFGYFWLYDRLTYFGRGQFLQKFLVFSQIVTFLLVALSPSIWAFALNSSFDYLLTGRLRQAGFVFQVLYVITIVLWMVMSSFKEKLYEWLYFVLAVMNAVIIMVITSAFIYLSIKNFALLSIVGILVTFGPMSLVMLTPDKRLPILGPLKHILLPDGEVWFAIPVICFLLYLPTFVSTIPLYSFARTWDLSWGNRDTVALGHDSSEALKQRNYARAQSGLACLVTLNVLLILVAMGSAAQSYTELELFFVSVILFAFVLVQLIFSVFYWVVWYWAMGFKQKLADSMYVLWATITFPSRGVIDRNQQEKVLESFSQRNLLSWHEGRVDADSSRQTADNSIPTNSKSSKLSKATLAFGGTPSKGLSDDDFQHSPPRKNRKRIAEEEPKEEDKTRLHQSASMRHKDSPGSSVSGRSLRGRNRHNYKQQLLDELDEQDEAPEPPPDEPADMSLNSTQRQTRAPTMVFAGSSLVAKPLIMVDAGKARRADMNGGHLRTASSPRPRTASGSRTLTPMKAESGTLSSIRESTELLPRLSGEVELLRRTSETSAKLSSQSTQIPRMADSAEADLEELQPASRGNLLASPSLIGPLQVVEHGEMNANGGHVAVPRQLADTEAIRIDIKHAPNAEATELPIFEELNSASITAEFAKVTPLAMKQRSLTASLSEIGQPSLVKKASNSQLSFDPLLPSPAGMEFLEEMSPLNPPSDPNSPICSASNPSSLARLSDESDTSNRFAFSPSVLLVPMLPSERKIHDVVVGHSVTVSGSRKTSSISYARNPLRPRSMSFLASQGSNDRSSFPFRVMSMPPSTVGNAQK